MSRTLWVVPAGAGDEVLTLVEAGHWRFDAALLLRVRVMHRIERQFDAVPELVALVADLQDEISRLRARLHQAS